MSAIYKKHRSRLTSVFCFGLFIVMNDLHFDIFVNRCHFRVEFFSSPNKAFTESYYKRLVEMLKSKGKHAMKPPATLIGYMLDIVDENG